MSKKRYRPEDLISKLREADIHINQGKTVAETIRFLGVSDTSKLALKLRLPENLQDRLPTIQCGIHCVRSSER